MTRAGGIHLIIHRFYAEIPAGSPASRKAAMDIARRTALVCLETDGVYTWIPI